MSELQLGLVSVGLAILLLVVGYNAWQRFKLRRMLPRSSPARKAAGLDKIPVQAKQAHMAHAGAMQYDPQQTHAWQEDSEPFLEMAAFSETDAHSPKAMGNAGYMQPTTPSKAGKKQRGWWPWAKHAPKNQHNEHEEGRAGQAIGGRLSDDFADKNLAIEPSLQPYASLQESLQNESQEATAQGVSTEVNRQTTPEESSALMYAQNGIDSADMLAARLFKGARRAQINERIDAIVQLQLPTSVSAERLMTLAQRQRRVGNKPVLVEALHGKAHETQKAEQQLSSDKDSAWHSPEAGERYEQIRVAVQLANRSGALNELEFSEFASGVHALAKNLNANFELPSMQQTVMRARQLDTFALACDVQLCVNLLSDGAPWSAYYVQQTATQDDFVLSRDGARFVKLDAQNNPMFMLYCGQTNFLRDDLTYSGSSLITLLLDVPIADEEQQPFRAMCEYARVLGKRIGGRIVDDQRQPLSDAALSSIEKRLMALYGVLEEAGLPAGTPAARRLFSHG